MASIRVERVFGGEPLCEIGRPVAAALSGDGGLLVVSGSFWWPDRLGIGFGQRSNPHPGWYPVGVYDAETLTCLHLRHLDRAILRIDIHPTRPIAAAITRRGLQHAVESEVLILDLATAALVSVAVVALHVHRVVWRDDETADLLVATAEGRFFWTVRRDDWHRPTPGMLGPPDPRPRVVRLDEPENVRFNETDRFVLDHWCRDRGIVRTQRTDVWGLEGLGDGRILAALWPVAAEVWSPDADGPVWRVALPEFVRGLQVRVRGGRALALTQPFGAEDTQCLVYEFDLATGAELGRQLTDEGCLLVVRADGWWATRAVGGHSDGHVTVYDPAGARVGTAELGRFRSWAHGLDVRDAPDLLFVHGDDTETRVVVAVDPPGTVRRLFPVAWDGDVDADVRIGCGVYVDGTLVHAALRIKDYVLLPGNAVVVRREYPGGAPLWLFQADHQVTALDVADGQVFVALNTGDLFVLALEDGSVLGRTGLTVGGHRVLPWSLSRSGAGRVAIGTADGRVLDCAVT